MNPFSKVALLLCVALLCQCSLKAQWVRCANVPGNDSIYATPGGVGLKDLAVNGSRLFVARISAYDSVFYSDDNGASWQVTRPGSQILGNYPQLADIWVHDGTVFASGTQGTGSGTLYLWRSSDNGGTWSTSSTGLTATPQVFCGSGSILYGGTQSGGVFLSTDNGLSWDTARTGITTFTFSGITSYVNVNGLAAVGSDVFAALGGDIVAKGAGIVHTTLGGRTWTSVNAGLPTNAVAQSLVAIGSTLYADVISYSTFVYGVYKSTDLGASWTRASTGLPAGFGSANYLYPVGNGLLAYANTALYQSGNGDTAWTAVNSTGLPSSYSVSRSAVLGSTMFITALDLSTPLKTTTAVWKRALSEFTEVRERSSAVPREFSLNQNYPNPFNPSTTIRFDVRRAGFVSLKVFDVLGKEVATLVNEQLTPGGYEATFDGSHLTSGVYVYRLQAGSFSDARTLVLLK